MIEMTEDINFFDGMEGTGLDSIPSNEQAIPYLGMVQPDSEAAANGAIPGVWRNTATGNIVNVIPLVFKVIWNERESQTPFRIVGRYEEVTIQQPKGGKGYPKLINPETGNEVQELYVYAITLPEHPEVGVLLFNPTVSSMTTCKAWNLRDRFYLTVDRLLSLLIVGIWYQTLLTTHRRRVLTFGAEKYAPHSWENVEDGINRYYAAALRHLLAWRRGEKIDHESGKNHLHHVACNMMILSHFEEEEEF